MPCKERREKTDRLKQNITCEYGWTHLHIQVNKVFLTFVLQAPQSQGEHSRLI